MTDSTPATAARWWRRNRVLFTHLLPLLLLAAGIGAAIMLNWAPRQAVTNVYVVCPDNPHQWCSHIGVKR